MDGKGGFIEPLPASEQMPCRFGEGGVVPPAHARRFTLLYDVPAGMALKLQYRGFEKDDAVIEIRR